MVTYKPKKCPYCGATKTTEKCAHCGQVSPLDHDTRVCQCPVCLSVREDEKDRRDADFGMDRLRQMKQVRREDEAARKAMGLPANGSHGHTTIIVGNDLKECPSCGYKCGGSFKFCTNCGYQF